MAADEARALGSRVDSLLESMQELPDPAVADRVEELIGAIVSLYGTGLERLIGLLREQADGERRLRELAGDDLVAHLLLLHDLHPDDVDTRVQKALDSVRPYLGSHAGGVEYLGVDEEGVANLRLQGSCDGCPSSTVTVQLAIEQAVLEAAPEVVSVAVEGMVVTDDANTGNGDEPTLLQIQPFRGGARAGSAADAAAEDADDGWHHFDVTAAPGEAQSLPLPGMSLVVCNVRGTPYAYRGGCPACAASLHEGRLDGDVLACPACGATYNVRLAGRGISDRSAALEPLPLLPEGTRWKVAIPRVATV